MDYIKSIGTYYQLPESLLNYISEIDVTFVAAFYYIFREKARYYTITVHVYDIISELL